MKRRDSLLRLKRFRVDDLKRRIATLDEMKADLEKKLNDLDDTVTRERSRANDSDIGRLAFPSFLQSIKRFLKEEHMSLFRDVWINELAHCWNFHIDRIW